VFISKNTVETPKLFRLRIMGGGGGESTSYVRHKHLRPCFVIKSIEKRTLEAATDIKDTIKITLFK
jgi:hypothetical protein